MYKNVCKSFICNSQTLETTQISIDRRRDKSLYAHTMGNYSAIKEQTNDANNNMEKLKKHVLNERHIRVHTKKKKRVHTVWFHLHTLQKQATLIYLDINQNGDCLWAGELTGREQKETFRGDGDVLYFNLGNGCVRFSEFIKLYTRTLVYFTAINYTLAKY